MYLFLRRQTQLPKVILRGAAVIALFLSGAYASGSIYVPSVIIARHGVSIFVNFDFAWDYYRLYLTNDDDGYLIANDVPLCYLTDVLSRSERTPSIYIPNDVGPPGNTYHIKLHNFNTTTPAGGDTAHTFTTSAKFELKDTNVSNWSPQEWKGPAWEYDSVPCSAMACNRKCKESAYATTTMKGTSYEDYCLCLAKCPDVSTNHGNWGDGCGFDWRYNLKTESSRPSQTTMADSTTTDVKGGEQSTTIPDRGTSSGRLQDTTATTTSIASTTTVPVGVSQPSSTGAAHTLVPVAVQAAIRLLMLT